MQALTPILINLLFPRSASAPTCDNEPLAFSAGYHDDRDEYDAVRQERRQRQPRRHHSIGARYHRQSLQPLVVEINDDHRNTTPQKTKRMSLDSRALFHSQPSTHRRHQPSSSQDGSSISSLLPLASPVPSRTQASHRAGGSAGINETRPITASSSPSASSGHGHHSSHSHRDTMPRRTATFHLQDHPSLYQPGDEHEHLAESEWVATASSSPRPSTCSMTSSFSSSSSSYSSLCEPLTPTSASHSHYHSNDHFRRPSPLPSSSSQSLPQHYALSDKDTAGQPFFVNLASHQWTTLDDE